MADRHAEEYDCIIIGSGVNSLVAGALLAKAGWRVCVLERNSVPGGALQTAEITAPGFLHDVFSGWHILFHGSMTEALLAEELAKTSLQYLESSLTAASLHSNGQAVFLSRDLSQNIAELDRFGDGTAWQQTVEEFGRQADITLSLLGTDLRSRSGLTLGFKAFQKLHLEGLFEFAGQALMSARDWLSSTFRSEQVQGLFAPWVLHTGLGPESATSGMMLKTMAVMLQQIGVPIPKGGGARLVDALIAIVERHGGHCLCDQDVERIDTTNDKAHSVITSKGRRFEGRHAILANVTPNQLYDRLLAHTNIPPRIRQETAKFRYGRADMQIHFALSAKPKWYGDPRLSDCPIVNLTDGLDAVSKAVNEAIRGLIPADPTICVGQPVVIDPSRAPAGSWILWIQLLEMPSQLKGDARAEINTPGGVWTETVREAVADRVQQKLAAHIENFDEIVIKRTSLSPADLEAANINLVHGDPYSGSCELAQNLLFRPLAGQPPHETPVKDLYHIGASTWPGPGLGGGSGSMVAKAIIRKHNLLFEWTTLTRKMHESWPER